MSDLNATQSYEERIAVLDATDSSELINNSSADHAVPLIARLFARGRRAICVFSGSLNPEIYAKESVVSALGVFLLGRSGTLKIVLQRQAAEVSDDVILGEGGLLRALRDKFGEEVLKNVFVRRAPAKVLDVSSHFLIVDNEGFRLEPDNTKHEAVASFNRPEFTMQLRVPFDQLFNAANEISIDVLREEVASA